MKIKVKDLNGPLIFFLTREMTFWRYELWNFTAFRPVSLFCQRNPKSWRRGFSWRTKIHANPQNAANLFCWHFDLQTLCFGSSSCASWQIRRFVVSRECGDDLDSLSAATLLDRPCPPRRSPTRVSPRHSARRFDQLVSTFIRFLSSNEAITAKRTPRRLWWI